MSVVVNTNIDSIKIQNRLTNSLSKMSTSMQRMSTGLKVNSAKDDAAGTVISARMKVQISGNNIAQNNIQNANAMLSTVEGYLDTVQDNLTRLRDLMLQTKNDTYSVDEIKAMQDEFHQLAQEIDRIYYSAEYSGIRLFESGNPDIVFQVGADGDENNTISADADILFKGDVSELWQERDEKVSILPSRDSPLPGIASNKKAVAWYAEQGLEFD